MPLKEKKVYYTQNSSFFSNYDVNLITVMITWGRNSVIYDLFTCDINSPA